MTEIQKYVVPLTLLAGGALSGCVPGRPDLAGNLYLDCKVRNQKGIATESVDAPVGEIVKVSDINVKVEAPGRVSVSSNAFHREQDMVIVGTGVYAWQEYAVAIKTVGENTRITARIDCENPRIAPAPETRSQSGFSPNRLSTKASPLAYKGFGYRK